MLAFALCAANFTFAFAEEEKSEIQTAFADYFVGTTDLDTDGYIGIPVSLDVYTKDTAAESAPVILYVINHGMERVGTESDVDILTDLLDEGYIVMTMDYKNNAAAVSPGLDWSIHKLRSSVKSSGTYLQGLSYDEGKTYVVPAGNRIMRDVLYFSYDESASKGTFEYIVKVYNEYIVPKYGEQYGLSEAETIEDCVKPDGSPFDLDLKLDIIYPSKPEGDVPVFMLASSAPLRNNSTTTENRPHHTGFLMRGYACVCYDHEYLPMSRADHYGLGSPYSLASTNGVKTHTAAVRRVRSLADELGYSKDAIGSWGHSKSAYTVLLTNPNPEEQAELSSYSGFEGEYGVQPWLTYEDGTEIPSNVQVAYSSMGNGAQFQSRRLTADDAPVIIACGQYDEYGCWDWWPELVANYEKSGIAYLPIPMKTLGHTYPSGYDNELGFDRYDACFDYFDYYLKSGKNPQILYSIPLEEEIDVAESDEISMSVKFLQPVTEETVIAGAALTASDGTEAEGTWVSSEGGTMWTFSTSDVKVGETYTFSMADVADVNGKITDDEVERTYTIIDSSLEYELHNVAYGKTVSSNQASYVTEYERLSELVDEVTAVYSNRWVNNYNYPGTNPRPAYVEIDLDGYYKLYFADVYNGWGSEGNNIVNYELQYLAGDEWKTIPGSKVENNTQAHVYTDFETPVVANKVRLYTDDTEQKSIRLNEIRIFGFKTEETPSGTTTNVALGKSVTAGALCEAAQGSAAENVVDGISSGYTYADTWWINQYRTAPDQTWLEIDLGDTYEISKSVMVSGYGDDGLHRCTDYKFQYWTGTEWADIPGGANSANASVKDELTFTETIVTNKVKFISNHNVFRVREIEIYGIKAETEVQMPANVALGKSTTAGAVSAGTDGSAPENVVDGSSSGYNYADTWWVNAYVTAPDKTWLEIDLDGTYKISSSVVSSGYGTSGSVHKCTDYKFQYWTGTEWADIPGGATTENDSITSTLVFTEPVITTKVKFICNHNTFRVREIEIYGVECIEPSEEIGAKWTVTTDSVRCTKVIENIDDTTKEYTLLVAEYDSDGNLEEVNLAEVSLPAGETRALSTFIPVPETGNTVKAFVWDKAAISPVLEQSVLTAFTKD